jgi:hypothetical protein
MKYLIALFLFVSPGFACEHRSSFLHKMPDFQLLFRGFIESRDIGRNLSKR